MYNFYTHLSELIHGRPIVSIADTAQCEKVSQAVIKIMKREGFLINPPGGEPQGGGRACVGFNPDTKEKWVSWHPVLVCELPHYLLHEMVHGLVHLKEYEYQHEKYNQLEVEASTVSYLLSAAYGVASNVQAWDFARSPTSVARVNANNSYTQYARYYLASDLPLTPIEGTNDFSVNMWVFNQAWSDYWAANS